MDINKDLLIFLNSFTQKDWIISNFVYIFSDAPIFFLPLFLLWFWFYFTYKKNLDWKIKLLHIFYSVILAIILSLIIQNIITIDRPENYLQTTWKLILSHLPDASFPSDHASVSFAFLVSLFFTGFKKIWFFFLPFVIIMNLSRVMWGIHWPFDILAWAIVWTVSSIFIFKYLQKKSFIKILDDFILKFARFFKL